MLSDTPFPKPFGSLSPELHLPATAKHGLFDFIADEMPAWRDDPDRPVATAETVLTSSLCAHLNTVARHSEAWNRIQFLPEEPDEAKAGRKLTCRPNHVERQSGSRVDVILNLTNSSRSSASDCPCPNPTTRNAMSENTLSTKTVRQVASSDSRKETMEQNISSAG